MLDSDSEDGNSWVVVEDPEDTVSLTWKDVLQHGGVPLCGDVLPNVNSGEVSLPSGDRATTISSSNISKSKALEPSSYSTSLQPISDDDAKLLRASKYECSRFGHLRGHTGRKRCNCSLCSRDNEDKVHRVNRPYSNRHGTRYGSWGQSNVYNEEVPVTEFDFLNKDINNSRDLPCTKGKWKEVEADLAARAVRIVEDPWSRGMSQTKHYYLKVLGNAGFLSNVRHCLAHICA